MGERQFSLVPITHRVRLTDETSEKQTFHLELDLQGTGIRYAVGDCLAVVPHNDPVLVASILSYFSEPLTTPILSKRGHCVTAYEFLTSHANLVLPTKHLTEKLGEANYLTDFLSRLEGMSLTEFCSYLAPLAPRFYSIASSMLEVGEKAHLTVTVNYLPQGHPLQVGTCSDFLCHRAPLHEPMISVAHHPSRHFGLPPSSLTKPIIMIGPGTGVAPFRGFMQERTKCGAHPKNWLFFGERTQKGHFYYQQEWEGYQQAGHLQLDVAFSRDQDQKIYVQNKMLERASEFWQWLHDEEAFLFVCGDAKQMAKEVDQTLLDICQNEGKMTLDAAKDYIKNLRKQHRYLRDVY